MLVFSLPTIIAIFLRIFPAFIWSILPVHLCISTFSSISVQCDAICYLSQWSASPETVFSYLYLSNFNWHYVTGYQVVPASIPISDNFNQIRLATWWLPLYLGEHFGAYFLGLRLFCGAFLLIFYSIFILPRSISWIMEFLTKVEISSAHSIILSARYVLRYGTIYISSIFRIET